MTWVHRTLIIAASQVALARSLCSSLPPGNSGANMLERGLSASGSSPATHYVSSGLIQEEFAQLLTNPAAIVSVAALHGISLALEDVNNMLAAADISEEGAEAAMERLGLKFVQEEEG